MFTELRGLMSPINFEDFNNNILENVLIEDLEIRIIKKGFSVNKLGKKVSIPTGLSLSKTKSDPKIVKKDYVKELERNAKQGVEAEKLVLNLEIEHAKGDPELQQNVDDIEHVALNEGDGLGYDIKSIYFDEVTKRVKPFCIEVKSTIGGINSPFYLSANEKRVAEEKGKEYSVTFAKYPSPSFPQQPKPKHRFSAISLPQSLLILPQYPPNPPRTPHNQASGPPFRRQQAHLAC